MDDEYDRGQRDQVTEPALDAFSLRGAERYTMTEAARLKGVSYHTVSRAVRQERFPVVRLGRMVLISGDDLERWQPMRARAPRRYRQAPEELDESSVVLDEALGDRLEIARQLSTLFEVIHAASSKLTMQEFGDLLAGKFATIFGLGRVTLWLSEANQGKGRRLATVGGTITDAPDHVDISKGYQRFFDFIELGSAQVSLDPQREFVDDPEQRERLPVGPLLIVPLRVGDHTLGALIGDRNGDRLALDEDQLLLAQVLGNQAALALDNALLRKDQQFRIAQLSAILDQMSDQVRACDREGRLNLINRADKVFDSGELAPPPRIGSDALENAGVFERFELDGTPIPRERHPLARALRGEVITGWEYELRRTDGRVQRAQVNARPLIVDGEITGAVYIGRNVTALREAEQRARERITRIERANERAQAIAAMAMRISTVDSAKEAMNIALECIDLELACACGMAFTLEATGTLALMAANGVCTAVQLPDLSDPISISTTILAFSRRMPVVTLLDEAGQAEQRMMTVLDASALLVVPLQIENRHLGAIHIYHDERSPLTADDCTFAATVGHQCAQALERIRLHDELAAIQS